MGFKYDEELSVQEGNEQRRYKLEKLDLTTRNILDVGVIAQVAMERTGFTGSEDYSDLFDSVGVVLRYSANRMLRDVYKGDDNFEGEEFDWNEAKMDELHLALETIEQFMLIGKLKK